MWSIADPVVLFAVVLTSKSFWEENVLDESGFWMKVVLDEIFTFGKKVVLDEIFTFWMKVVVDELVFHASRHGDTLGQHQGHPLLQNG